METKQLSWLFVGKEGNVQGLLLALPRVNKGILIADVGRVFCAVSFFSGHRVGSPALFARTPGLGKVQHCQ